MSQQKSRYRPALQLEALDRRELYAGDLLRSLPATVEPELTPAQRLAQYASSNWQSVGKFTEATHFTSRAELDAKLAALVQEYWRGVFDKPVKEVGWRYTLAFDQGLRLEAATSGADNLQSVRVTGPTNVQTVGIDEGDTFEVTADGYLYVSTASGISVVDIRDPAKMTASRLEAKDVWNSRLIVSGDRLLRTSQVNSEVSIYGSEFKSWTPKTLVEIFDVSSRMTPKLISKFEFEGNEVAARAINGQLTLVTSQSFGMLLPEVAVVRGSDGQDRFESAERYLARNRDQILSAVLPDYQQGLDGKTAGDLGSWQDIALGADLLQLRTSIIRLDFTASTPKILGSELLVGVANAGVYLAGDNLYIFSASVTSPDVPQPLIVPMVFSPPEFETKIYKFNMATDGEVGIVDSISLPMAVWNSRWMSEYKGVLRVAGTTNDTANIYTIGTVGGDWKVLGKLVDIAADQSLLSAYFEGDRALVTTGVTAQGLFFDPLHGIDLSDPANPRELSEVVIPGFTTYLQKIDATHWIGVGYDLSPDQQTQNLQVSLYEASDLTKPRLVDRWVGTADRFSTWLQPDSLGISFDPGSGLLVIGSSFVSSDWGLMQVNKPPVFKIDLSSSQPLQALNTITYPESINRSFVRSGHLFAIGQYSVIAQDVKDLTKLVGQVFPGPAVDIPIYRSVSPGQTDVFPLLAGWDPKMFSVLSVTNNTQVKVSVADDGNVTVVVPDDVPNGISEVQIEYRYNNGPIGKIRLTIATYTYVPYEPIAPVLSDAHTKILARFEDSAGQKATEFKSGDEVWVVLSVLDLRNDPKGVFAAYFDVQFDSQNVTVIGEPEFYSEFANGRQKVASGKGYSALGAFGGTTPSDEEIQDVVRFKVRIDSSQAVTMTITPSQGVGREFLLYGESGALKNENIEPATLTTAATDSKVFVVGGEASPDHDFNDDGVISGLDVLLMINYINGQAVTSASTSTATLKAATGAQSPSPRVFDVSGDGSVTGLDVLQVINAINARGSGEGEATPPITTVSSAWAVDQVFAADPTSDIIRRSRRV